MSDTRFVRAITLESFGSVVDDIEGVQLRHLPPLTTLLVRTTNSLYRVVITEAPQVYVQGGAHFPDPTSAWLDATSIGGTGLTADWIGLGLLVQIRAQDRCIMTSPVLGIAAERLSGSVVH